MSSPVQLSSYPHLLAGTNKNNTGFLQTGELVFNILGVNLFSDIVVNNFYNDPVSNFLQN